LEGKKEKWGCTVRRNQEEGKKGRKNHDKLRSNAIARTRQRRHEKSLAESVQKKDGPWNEKKATRMRRSRKPTGTLATKDGVPQMRREKGGEKEEKESGGDTGDCAKGRKNKQMKKQLDFTLTNTSEEGNTLQRKDYKRGGGGVDLY